MGIWITVLEIVIRLFGFGIGFLGSEKEKKEWLAKASQYLREKGWLRSEFVLKLEADRNQYLDNLMEQEMKKQEITDQMKIYLVGEKEAGTVEFKPGSNPIIEKYHRYASVDNDESMTDEVPWCSAFMCYCVEMAGFESTNSRLARSWMKWGQAVEDPKLGDIVVFWRESRDSYKGHVGFFRGFDDDGNVISYGGNQGDAVRESVYRRDQVLGFRRINAI